MDPDPASVSREKLLSSPPRTSPPAPDPNPHPAPEASNHQSASQPTRLRPQSSGSTDVEQPKKSTRPKRKTGGWEPEKPGLADAECVHVCRNVVNKEEKVQGGK